MNSELLRFPEIMTVMYKQDDPKKCTASRLVKFKLAKEVRKPPFNTIILDPFSANILTKKDSIKFKRVCAIDCSWKLANNVIKYSKNYANTRKLPTLLAGNPVNYSKPNILSTVEALAASLYIMEYKDLSKIILDKFRWGHTFLELNFSPLEEYSKASDPQEIKKIEREYFPQLFLQA